MDNFSFTEETESFSAFDDVMRGGSGPAGAVFTPHISPEGILTWTNNGGLENPPPFNFYAGLGNVAFLEYEEVDS